MPTIFPWSWSTLNRPNSAYLKSIRKLIAEYSIVSDQELRSRSSEYHNYSSADVKANNALEKTIAISATVLQRLQGFRLHDVQLQAIHHLTKGHSVELHTGEGKTLVAAIASTAMALLGRTIHVSTTNAYLATRDQAFMSPCNQFLGISTAVLTNTSDPLTKKSEYEAQIIYGPGHQFGFDYLQQQHQARMSKSPQFGQATLKSLSWGELLCEGDERSGNSAFRMADFMIVDEADSVLIDEAMSPLILAEKSSTCEDYPTLVRANAIASKMIDKRDFLITKSGAIDLVDNTNEAFRFSNSHELKTENSNQLRRSWKHYLLNALKANFQLKCGIHYIIKGDDICLVDQQTGRLHPERQFQYGLHEAVIVKHGIRPTGRSKTLARTTRQSFFKRYNNLVGMSGTLMPTAREFAHVYQMQCFAIPTHKPLRRTILQPRTFVSDDSKLIAIAEECRVRNQRNQPVLIGTRSILASEKLAHFLQAKGLRPVLLNGKQDRQEADIVQQAGTPGTLTIATNMAGRGTDIPLPPQAEELGGLHVIASEPNLTTRGDLQLFGRTARQGQSGSAQLFASLDDEILSCKPVGNCPENVRRTIRRNSNASGESSISTSKLIRRLQLEQETASYAKRLEMMQSDHWLNATRQSLSG